MIKRTHIMRATLLITTLMIALAAVNTCSRKAAQTKQTYKPIKHEAAAISQ